LCSDGLTKHLDDDAISSQLHAHPTSAREAAEALVRKANERGGTDNVTVVVARFQ
jgi:protein phosphatase